MHQYVIQPIASFCDDERIEFSANNASIALKHVHQGGFSQPVGLWEDGKLLCTLSEQRFGKGQMWTITSVNTSG